MRFRCFIQLVCACLLLSSIGCSSLGISLHSGATLTTQTEELLQCSPAAATLPRELAQSVLPDHFLQPGDALLIETVDFESEIRLPADQRVMADGRIDLGEFGRVVVAGLTLERAEEQIEQAIARLRSEQTNVNVRLLESVHRFYVLGEVNSPGSYPLVGHETVLDGILAGGGLASTANPCKILLARPTAPSSCRVTLPVCYREITQLGDTSTNYQLQPGDRIFVASRSWCDELKFWEANQTCERCRRCQTACAEPAIAAYSNPIAAIPAIEVTSLPATIEEPPAEKDSSPPAPVTSRLPATADGELEFEWEKPAEPTSSGRFEPLWITPT